MKLSIPFITKALCIAGALGVLLWWISPKPMAEQAIPQKQVARTPSLSKQASNPVPLSRSSGPESPQVDDSFQPGLPVKEAATSSIPGQQPTVSLARPPASAPATAADAPKTIEERASMVQQQANRELERLVPLLNLTEEQQDRVFARLAQNSVFWTPALTTNVSTGSESGAAGAATPSHGSTVTEQTKSIPDLLLSTPEGETPILNPDQEIAVAQDQLDRQAWWEEVLGNIQKDIQDGTSTTSAAAAAAAPSVTNPAPDPTRDLATDPIIKTEQGADTVVD